MGCIVTARHVGLEKASYSSGRTGALGFILIIGFRNRNVENAEIYETRAGTLRRLAACT